MIVIKSLDVTKPFKYLWLKNVKGVDLSVHCAKCLVGEYDKHVSNRIYSLGNYEIENGIYYLCGVSKPYKWENNFHLAFEYSENASIVYKDNGISVVIENAKRLPINTDYIDETNMHAHKPAYNTCRNWQFANYLNKTGKVKNVKECSK